MVCTVDLGCILDLRKIALKTKNSEYNPKRFHALIIRLRNPKTTAMIFKSGKLVCTGAKDEQTSRQAIKKFVQLIKNSGFSGIKIKNYSIRNLVAVCNFNLPIRLESINFTYKESCMYEPEVFPGLIFRPENTKVVAMIFMTGRVVLTGIKSIQEMERIHNNLTYMILNTNNLV